MRKFLIILFTGIFLSACTNKITSDLETIRDTIAPAPTKITDLGLPDQHIIKTVFIPQAPENNWDQPWQDACEEASLLTVKYFYSNIYPNTTDLVYEYQQIFSYELQNNWNHDINLSQMAQIAQKLFHLRTNIIDNPSIDQIKTYISQNIPVVITANGKTLYEENKHFHNGGPWYHSLVILGYNDNIGKFIVHDVGTQFGANYKYSYQLLMNSIHDYPTTLHKEDIETGSKKILVLLK